MRTDSQIDKEIAKLKAMKPTVRRFTAFGDDNWQKIDAQIKTLENRWVEDEVFEEYEDADNPDRTYDIVSNAREASDWMYQENDAPKPSDGWKELVQK